MHNMQLGVMNPRNLMLSVVCISFHLFNFNYNRVVSE
jgi:hypothetical protein